VFGNLILTHFLECRIPNTLEKKKNRSVIDNNTFNQTISLASGTSLFEDKFLVIESENKYFKSVV